MLMFNFYESVTFLQLHLAGTYPYQPSSMGEALTSVIKKFKRLKTLSIMIHWGIAAYTANFIVNDVFDGLQNLLSTITPGLQISLHSQFSVLFSRAHQDRTAFRLQKIYQSIKKWY